MKTGWVMVKLGSMVYAGVQCFCSDLYTAMYMFFHNTITLFHDHIRGLAKYFLYFLRLWVCNL